MIKDWRRKKEGKRKKNEKKKSQVGSDQFHRESDVLPTGIGAFLDHLTSEKSKNKGPESWTLNSREAELCFFCVIL